MEMMKQERQ